MAQKEGSRKRFSALEEALYISRDVRTQMQGLPPEQMSNYTRIEHLVGETLVQLFPGVFTAEQQTYLTTPLTVVLREDQLENFRDNWHTESITV